MKRTALKRPTHVERTCRQCGGTFTIPAAWARRGGGQFCGRVCVDAWRNSPEGRAEQSAKALSGREPSPSNRRGRVADRARFNDASGCRWPGCRHRGKLDQHHVVYRQHVTRAGGDVWDGRNALALCAVHHATHHHQLTKVPLGALRDENYAYAADLLGAAAFNYLRRRYGGDDHRLAALLDAPTDAAAAPRH